MKKFLVLAVALLAACDNTTTTPIEPAEDYALLSFGEFGTALENTMGVQDNSHPVDGRTGAARLPDSLKLSNTQIAQIKALRDTFVVKYTAQLIALKSIFDDARQARRAGASREEILNILAEARPIIDTMRDAVRKLHFDIRQVYTTAQRVWLDRNRPNLPRCLAIGC